MGWIISKIFVWEELSRHFLEPTLVLRPPPFGPLSRLSRLSREGELPLPAPARHRRARSVFSRPGPSPASRSPSNNNRNIIGSRPEHSPSDPLEPRIAMAHRLDLVCRCQLTTPPVHVRNMQPMRCAHHGLLPTPRTLLSCPDLHLLSCSRQKLNKNILTMLVHLLPSNHTQRFPANHIQRI